MVADLLLHLISPYIELHHLMSVSRNMIDYREKVRRHIRANYKLDEDEGEALSRVADFRNLPRVTYFRIFRRGWLIRQISFCTTLDVRHKVRLLQDVRHRKSKKRLELFFNSRFVRQKARHHLVEDCFNTNRGVLVLGNIVIFKSRRGFRVYSLTNRSLLLAQSVDGMVEVSTRAPPVIGLMLSSAFVFQTLYTSSLSEEPVCGPHAHFSTVEFCKKFRRRISS